MFGVKVGSLYIGYEVVLLLCIQMLNKYNAQYI